MAIKLQNGAKKRAQSNAEYDEYFDAPPIVRFDERRMHVRAYNYWASLLGENSLPSIEDLNPSEIQDFGSHSVLLDFTAGVENPAVAFLGTALAAQCDVDTRIERINQIPARTLLSRLTDHYLQIIANAAPISFEAEFTNQRGVEILYRGIMMPFSSDHDTIDFVYGVINWKEVASEELAESIEAEVGAALRLASAKAPPAPIWADGPIGSTNEGDALDLTLAMIEPGADLPGAEPEEYAELADHLAAARDAAAIAVTAESRSRAALYRAVSLAHAFAMVARIRRDDYLELLEDSGLTENERNPAASLVRLVFGIDYDKTRMAEFARAIEHAIASDVAPGALSGLLGSLPGGLKAWVAQARAAARGDKKPALRKSGARKQLAARTALSPDTLSFDDTALAIAVVRRDEHGAIEIVGGLTAEDQLVERVMRSVAKTR